MTSLGQTCDWLDVATTSSLSSSISASNELLEPIKTDPTLQISHLIKEHCRKL